MKKVHPLIRCIFIFPALLWFLAIVIYPLFNSIQLSFFEWNAISSKSFVGIANYKEMLSDSIVITAVKNSLILTAAAVSFQLPIAMFFAVILSQSKLKGRNFFRTIYFFPVILSSALVGILWSQIYDPNFGLINGLLQFLGFSMANHAWLGSMDTAMGSVIVVVVWQFIGNYILIYYMSIQGISEDILEYASIDGAKNLTLFFKIQLPLIWPMVKITIILAIINSLKYFDLIYIMTSGGPSHSSEVLSTYIVNTAFNSMRFGYASTISVLLFGMGIFFLVITNTFLRMRKTHESI